MVLIATCWKAFTCRCTCILSLFTGINSRHTLNHVDFMSQCWTTSWEDKLKQGSLIFCASLCWCVFKMQILQSTAQAKNKHCFHIWSTFKNTQPILTQNYLSDRNMKWFVSAACFIFHSCCHSSPVVFLFHVFKIQISTTTLDGCYLVLTIYRYLTWHWKGMHLFL